MLREKNALEFGVDQLIYFTTTFVMFNVFKQIL